MDFEIDTNSKQVAAFLEKYEDRILRVASKDTINKSLPVMMRTAVESLSSSTRIPKGQLRRNKKNKSGRVWIPKRPSGRATMKRPYNGGITVGTNPYEAYKITTAAQRAKGASRKGGVRWRGGHEPQGFVATVKSGKTSYWRRQGQARTPIEKITIDMRGPGKRAGDAAIRAGLNAYEKTIGQNVIAATNKEIKKRGLS